MTTPCQPKHPAQQCLDCYRMSRAVPGDAEKRPTTLLLDVRSILPDAADCPLFVAVARPVYWWEKPEELAA